MTNPVYQLLLDALILFLQVGALLGIAIGLALSFLPHQTMRLMRYMNKTISMRQTTRSIEKSYNVESVFYRYSKLMGSLILIVDLYLLYMFGMAIDITSLAAQAPAGISQELWNWLLHAMRVFFIIAGIAIFVFALVVLIRPSVLKRLEKTANAWISTRQIFRGMNYEVGLFDAWLGRFPRLFGVLIAILALYVFVLLVLSW